MTVLRNLLDSYREVAHAEFDMLEVACLLPIDERVQAQFAF